LVRIGRDGPLRTDARGAADGQPVTVGLRPQDTRLATEDEPAVPAQVLVFEDFLEFGLATLQVPGVDGRVVAQTPPDVHWHRNDAERIAARPDRVYLFHAETGQRIR
jgi:multiple sugar transport system ATP-binding protein